MKRIFNQAPARLRTTSPQTAAARGALRRSAAAVVAAALLSASCTKEPESMPLPDGVREISITALLDGADAAPSGDPATGTKAPVTDGGANSKAVLADMHFLRKDGATVQTNFAGVTAVGGSRDASGKITFTTGSVPAYDKGNLNAWFAAYWPATAAGGATVTAGSKVVWTIDGSRDILVSTLDASKSYDAGKYTAPANPGMTLQHALARLQVVCAADATMDQAIVRAAWGKITKIQLLTSPATATYTYSTNALTYGAAGAVSLWKTDYSAKFENQALDLVKGSTAVTAEGMYPPGTGAVKLKVYSEKVTAGKEVSVQLASGSTNKNFERGLTHTITLSFGASLQQIGTTASISPWGTASDATAGKPDGIDPALPF